MDRDKYGVRHHLGRSAHLRQVDTHAVLLHNGGSACGVCRHLHRRGRLLRDGCQEGQEADQDLQEAVRDVQDLHHARLPHRDGDVHGGRRGREGHGALRVDRAGREHVRRGSPAHPQDLAVRFGHRGEARGKEVHRQGADLRQRQGQGAQGKECGHEQVLRHRGHRNGGCGCGDIGGADRARRARDQEIQGGQRPRPRTCGAGCGQALRKGGRDGGETREKEDRRRDDRSRRQG